MKPPLLLLGRTLLNSPDYFQFPGISWQLQHLCTLQEEQENVINFEYSSCYSVKHRQYFRLFDTVAGIGDYFKAILIQAGTGP